MLLFTTKQHHRHASLCTGWIVFFKTKIFKFIPEKREHEQDRGILLHSNKIKFTILTIFKCMVQLYQVYSQCWEATTTVRFQNVFIIAALWTQYTGTSCSLSLPPACGDLHSTSKTLPVLVPHKRGIMQYLPFCVWHISLIVKLLRLIHVLTCFRTSFLFIK